MKESNTPSYQEILKEFKKLLRLCEEWSIIPDEGEDSEERQIFRRRFENLNVKISRSGLKILNESSF
ncbi:hypothetical protein [Pollutibacter soli]|uniref:hypothetical protein n=1 Tax=Pollutibacter soli TaxID=3034157 RepID=UPI003013A95C